MRWGLVIVVFAIIASAINVAVAATPYKVGIVDNCAPYSPSVVVGAGQSIDMKVVVWDVTSPSVAGSSLYLLYDPSVISDVTCKGTRYVLSNNCQTVSPGNFLFEGYDTFVAGQGYIGDVVVAVLNLKTKADAPAGATTDLVVSAAPLGEALGTPVWGPGWVDVPTTFEKGTLTIANCSPGISVEKTASSGSGAPCTNVTFTILVNNTGCCTLSEVTVVDTLPQGMSYVSDDQSGVVLGNTITWNLGSLAPQGSVTIHLVAHVDQGATGSLENEVNATGTTAIGGDTVTSCDTVSVNALEPAIKVEKTAVPSLVQPSGMVNFTINVTNLGDATLNPVTVTDVLPQGVTYVSDDRGGVVNGNTVTWNNVGPLAPGSSTLIHLMVRVNQSATGVLKNNVTAMGYPPTGNPVSGNGQANVTVQQFWPAKGAFPAKPAQSAWQAASAKEAAQG